MDDTEHIGSEQMTSESITYTRPSTQVGTTVAHWDSSDLSTVTWDAVDGADYYFINVYKYDDSSEEWTYQNMWGTKSSYIDLSSAMNQYGAGQYRVQIKACSEDISTLANGECGEYSEIYSTDTVARTVSDSLDSAISNTGSATDAAAELTAEQSLSNIQTAMQLDETVRDKVAELEANYAAEQNITVLAPSVSEAASSYVDASPISVVGAGFNAAQGQDVSLQISAPDTPVSVSSEYPHNVQLDIKLVSSGEVVNGTLSMPVTITMPIPSGINAEQLVLLHYHSDGSVETLNPYIEDGYVTFTVKDFSTFVFADEGSEETDSYDTTGTDSTADTDVSTGDANTTEDNSADNTSNSNSDSTDADNTGASASFSDAFAAALSDIENKIRNAADGETITITSDYGMTALPNSIMHALYVKGTASLRMEYTYDGQDYVIVIPAGGAIDSDIPWYGPLYLAEYFGNGTTAATAFTYMVVSGDTLSRIVASNGMTLAQIAAKNPQIANVNLIYPGQIINL